MKPETSKKVDPKASAKELTNHDCNAAREGMDAAKPVNESVSAAARKEFSDLKIHLDDLISHIDENKLSYRDLEQFAHRAAEHLIAHFSAAKEGCPPGCKWCPGHPDGRGGWEDGKCIPETSHCKAQTAERLWTTLRHLT